VRVNASQRDPEADPRVLRARARAEEDAAEEAPGPADIAARLDPGARLRMRDTLVERIIRGAQERGAFDDLPYQGEPLPRVDDAAAGDMASAFRILRNANAAPPWIEADKDVRRFLADREQLLERAGRAGVLSRQRYRDQLRTLVHDHNRAVFVLNHEAPADRFHRRPLDLAAELAALEESWPR
jgi:hypothetical protein